MCCNLRTKHMDPTISTDNGGEYAAASDMPSTTTETRDVVRNDSSNRWGDGGVERYADQIADSVPDVASLARQDGAVIRSSTVPPAANILIVDVEGFQLKKDFYVKELAFYQPFTKEYWLATFKPPFDRQYVKKKYCTDMDWVTRNLHGLKWEEGQYPYSMAYYMINHFGSHFLLHAKGEEKSLWIQHQTPFTVINLELMGSPKAKELPFGCFCTFHNTLEKSCALDKAVRLGQFYEGLFTMHPINATGQ